VVIGDKEAELKKVSVRHRRHGDLGQMSREKLLERMKKEIDQHSLE